ncbi:MAG: pseudaminic acid cytidylyltransferase [Flavobacteriaceae bacterium]
MKKVAIIPARGGSKRIPRKNIKLFLGKPIIAYSITAALESNLFDEVMVSTEDEAIANLAQEYGAKVPFKRSQTTASDYATTAEVLLEVIQAYEKQGHFFDIGCCIYPTAPFVTSTLLQKGLSHLEKEKYDTVFPVLPFSFPIQRAVKINSQNRVAMFQPEHLTTRSQDLEPAYQDSGQFYWFNVATMKQKQQLWTDNSGVIHLPPMQAHDIDYLEDWEIAEFKYKFRSKQ